MSNTYEVELILAVPCSTCSKMRNASPSGTCDVCGEQLPEELIVTVHSAIRERRAIFKGRLTRLERRLNDVASKVSTFAIHGDPLSFVDHLNTVLRPFMQEISDRHSSVSQLLNGTKWDAGDDARITAFNKLVKILDGALTSIDDFRNVMPPLEWRAVHRELTRAAMEQLRGQVQITLAIIAPDLSSAMRQQENGRQSLAVGTRYAKRAGAVVDQIVDMPTSDPFQADGSIDIATLAWTGVRREPTSIINAAAIVRKAYEDIPNMQDLPDQYAVSLLSLLASARIVDHELLITRTMQLRSTLDRAGDSAQWVIDADLLVSRLQRGINRITVETERLGREWRHKLPRAHVMNSLTEIYRQLIEGALRDLGGIVLIAARAGRGDANGSYEEAVIDGIKAGEVVDELRKIGASCGTTVDMLYRNASAHADIEITDDGIVATERLIKDGRVEDSKTVTLSDAEFAEEVITLQEVLLALQLTLLPWACVDSRINTALLAMRPTLSQLARLLTLLGGMAGLTDIKVSRAGDRLIATADILPSDSDRRETTILSLVPGAFGAAADVNQMTLELKGKHSPG